MTKAVFNTSNNAAAYLQAELEQIGRERGLKPLPEELFVTVEGESYLSGGELATFPAMPWNAAAYFDERRPIVGTYCSNNNMLAVVNERGQLLCGPTTAARMAALKDAGYQRSEFFVPLSNGECLTNPELADTMAQMWAEARVEWKRDWRAAIEEEYSRNAIRNAGAEPGPVPKTFVKVDGVVYAGHKGLEVQPYNDANSVAGRDREAGLYASNNGVLAVVDAKGGKYVAAASAENFVLLDKAGYKPGSVDVPFSNGETPLGMKGQLSGGGLVGGPDRVVVGRILTALGYPDAAHVERVIARYGVMSDGAKGAIAAPGRA